MGVELAEAGTGSMMTDEAPRRRKAAAIAEPSPKRGIRFTWLHDAIRRGPVLKKSSKRTRRYQAWGRRHADVNERYANELEELLALRQERFDNDVELGGGQSC